jgi:hypothetical protein
LPHVIGKALACHCQFRCIWFRRKSGQGLGIDVGSVGKTLFNDSTCGKTKRARSPVHSARVHLKYKRYTCRLCGVRSAVGRRDLSRLPDADTLYNTLETLSKHQSVAYTGTELRGETREFIPGRKILEGVIFVFITN